MNLFTIKNNLEIRYIMRCHKKSIAAMGSKFSPPIALL